MNATSLILAGLIALAPLASSARDRPFVDEASTFREDIAEPEPWVEEGTSGTLPPVPEEADLLEFPVDDPGRGLRYYIDGKHLTVGVDGVVRYTLAIRSRGGALNISFEGMRCNTRKVKVYAFGDGRGKLRPITGAGWEPIPLGTGYRHHLDLHEFYFCRPLFLEPYERDEILRRLRSPSRSPGQTDGFLP